MDLGSNASLFKSFDIVCGVRKRSCFSFHSCSRFFGFICPEITNYYLSSTEKQLILVRYSDNSSSNSSNKILIYFIPSEVLPCSTLLLCHKYCAALKHISIQKIAHKRELYALKAEPENCTSNAPSCCIRVDSSTA